MTTTDTWTIGRLLTWTTDYLKQNGSDSARLDSEILLAHARECKRIELYTAFEEEPSEEVRTAFREMVRRRAEGTPVAYLVGHKEFYSASFEVNPDVLIPRPETEHLVLEALDRAKELIESGQDPKLHIVDVGTGSGIVAITLAKHLPESKIVAIDKSLEAMEVAQRNAKRNEVPEEQIQFLVSDLMQECAPEQKFNLIVSNPPYVSETEYENAPVSVREYEPRLALVAGPAGHELIVELLKQSEQYLADHGLVLIELSPMLVESVDSWLPENWSVTKTVKDLAGLARVLVLQMSH